MSARERILQRLREQAPVAEPLPEPDYSPLVRPTWDQSERILRFEQAICAVHGEVVRCSEQDWVEALARVSARLGVRNLLVASGHPLGRTLRDSGQAGLPELMAYDQPIEQWQERLFNDVDASLTSTLGGIAETGSLILWPTPQEPRLMSLVPPVHIALLRAAELHTTFHEALQEMSWQQGMPTNALLISGPSKTADIEQTLAYGVHGPKSLIVLLVE